MNRGVPHSFESPTGASLATHRRPPAHTGRSAFRAALIVLASLSTLVFTASAMAASASVGLATASIDWLAARITPGTPVTIAST